MTASDANKFTDQHVRARSDLYDLAVQYALEYQGEFDPLVRAHVWAQNNGQLSIATARMVLNCMRHDLNVAATLPDPYGLAQDASSSFGTILEDAAEIGTAALKAKGKFTRPLRAVPDYRPPVFLKVEFHYGYLVSTKQVYPSQTDPVGHILNHSRSGAKVERGRVVWWLKAWCGWTVRNDRWGSVLEAEVMERIPDGRRACKGCNKLILKAGAVE